MTGINGIVYDAGCRVPLVGATVVITDSASHVYTLTTGAGGWYTLTNSADPTLVAGLAQTVASYPGYAATTASTTIVADTVVALDVPLRTVAYVVTVDDDLTMVSPGQIDQLYHPS